MTPTLRQLHDASPRAATLIQEAGHAIACVRVWRSLRAEGCGPSVVDGELRASGYGKLRDARESLRRALGEVEVLIGENPDVVEGVTE